MLYVKNALANFPRVLLFFPKKFLILPYMIKLDVQVGDTILTGRFKNKRVKVKTIEYDEFGMPLINGKPGCTFRMVPNPRK